MKKVYARIKMAKTTMLKTIEVNYSSTNFWISVESKVKILDGREQKTIQNDNPTICKTEIAVLQWNANQTQELIQKELLLIFATSLRFFFHEQTYELGVLFLRTNLISWTDIIQWQFLSKLVILFDFFWEKFCLSSWVRHKKVGDAYYKSRFDGGHSFKGNFVVGVFEILLAAKTEGNCI